VIAPRIASALRRTAHIAIRRPRAALWTLLALTAALLSAGLAGLAAAHLGDWTRAEPTSASMVIYLGDGVDETRAAGLVAELAKLPGVERAELVTANESAARLQRALGGDAALLEGVELASLPASVEVMLAPGVRDVIAMSPTVHALRGTQGVDDIVVDDAERASGTLRVVRLVAWTGAALLAGLALIIVLASIRVRFDRDRREAAVVYLLGGRSTFVIVPTALAGALQGVLAAALAAGAFYAGYAIYGERITHAIGPVALPALSLVALFVAIGGALGLVGGGLAGASRAVR